MYVRLYWAYAILFGLEFMSSWKGTLSRKSRGIYKYASHNPYQYKKNCIISNNASIFGLHRLWQPMCKSRRQDDDMSKYQFPPDPGPPRSPNYDPTWGYEPYWATGDWVFEAGPWLAKQVCGHECPEFYKQYGQICGRSMNKYFTIKYKTFDNICEMQKEDCTGYYGWKVVYRGTCGSDLRTYPTPGQYKQFNARWWMTDFFSRYPTTPYKGTRKKPNFG